MKRIGMVLLLGLFAWVTPARTAVTFEYVFAGGYPLRITPNGGAIAGNTLAYGPFRWTQATGMVALGMDPTPSPGGSPGISADGTKVASTIANFDTTYATAGLWTLGTGWQQLMPPGGIPDAAISDRSDYTVYGLSGDGETVVGLYWRTAGRGHAFKWTQAGGGVDLGSLTGFNASRANGVNHDGSVIVGWDEHPTGPWRAAAWYNGVETLLSDPAGFGEAKGTNPAGTIVVGYDKNFTTDVREAAMWTRSGSTWSSAQHLGSVPGTAPTYGINYAHGVTDDGGMVVGYCSFDGSPFWTTGFVWTQATGTIDVVQWLANNGVAVDPGFGIVSLTGITPDGRWIIGYGRDLVSPYTTRAFRIHNTSIADVPTGTATPELALAAPSPNPSSGFTALAFTLSVAGDVDLAVFDAAGRRVATPIRMAMTAGPHSVNWDGRGNDGRVVPTGMYWARVSTAQGSASRRLVRIQ